MDDRSDSAADSARPDTTVADTGTSNDTGTRDDTGGIEDSSDAADASTDASTDADAKTDSIADADAAPTEVIFTFPSATDPRTVKGGTAWFNIGDFVQGSRATTLPKATGMKGTLEIGNSLGSCGADAGTTGSLDIRVSINGTTVGTIAITKASPASVSFDVLFGVIPGPTYVIRYEEITQVASGCGSITIKDDVAKLTLR